eukprot:TRINITY_DN1066_c1_g1_i4.p1 TRINITY_DN1066_c1_g1~~TRINITY_DN1066_c1_g1_i4.p1  ORF type:complete len:630 (+),score=96.38 TRINITY_DN1066_c1_g1_i4:9217-11106(+)
MYDNAMVKAIPDSTPAPRPARTVPIPQANPTIEQTEQEASVQKTAQRKFLTRGGGTGGGKGCLSGPRKIYKKAITFTTGESTGENDEAWAPSCSKAKVKNSPKKEEKKVEVKCKPKEVCEFERKPVKAVPVDKFFKEDKKPKVNYFSDDSDSDSTFYGQFHEIANTIITNTFSPLPKDEPQPVHIKSPPHAFEVQEAYQEEENKSKLVKKFFYGDEEKKEKQKATLEKKKQIEETKAISSVVDQKIEVCFLKPILLQELNNEIEQLKQEKERLKKQKLEQERIAKKLSKEIEAFQKQKEKELADLEELKKQEMQKLKKEKRVFERQVKAMQNVPNRKEREEIELLKKEVIQLKDELKSKETRYKLNMDRAKKQIDDLSLKNAELQNEVKILEDLHTKNKATTKKLKENVAPIDPPKPKKILADSTNTFVRKTQQPVEQPVSENESESYELKLPAKYHTKSYKVLSQTSHNDGKVTRAYENGKTEVMLLNGSRKETFPDGYSVTFFSNKDVKQVFPNGRVVYYSNETRTTQTTLPDGTEVYKLSNGQVEKHYADGAKEVTYPDGTVRCMFVDGEEEIIYVDGSVERVDRYGNRTKNFEGAVCSEQEFSTDYQQQIICIYQCRITLLKPRL